MLFGAGAVLRSLRLFKDFGRKHWQKNIKLISLKKDEKNLKNHIIICGFWKEWKSCQKINSS